MSDSFLQPRPQTLIVDGVGQVEEELGRRLGLKLEIFVAALAVGLSEAAMTTDNSAATSYGFRMWDGTTRELRDRASRQGWKAARPGQLEAVRRGDQQVQILAAMGDAGVCDPDATPSAAHPRGGSTYVAIQSNQLSFADVANEAAREEWETIQSWWLLYRPTPTEPSRIRAELSLPVEMRGTTITGWATRIFLPIDSNHLSRRPKLPKPALAIPVAVERKTS